MKFIFPRLNILEVALLVTFLALKLTNHIAWPWWIVLLPAYARYSLWLFCYIGYHAMDKLHDKLLTPQQRAQKRLAEKANALARALRARQ